MTIGLSFNGGCYADDAAVLAAHKLLYPLMDGTHVVNFVSHSIAGSTLSYSVASRSLDSNTAPATRSGSVALPACELGGVEFAEQGVIFAGLFLIIWALGFNGGLKR